MESALNTIGSESFNVLLIENGNAVCGEDELCFGGVCGFEDHVGMVGIDTAEESIHIIDMIAGVAESGQHLAETTLLSAFSLEGAAISKFSFPNSSGLIPSAHSNVPQVQNLQVQLMSSATLVNG